MSLFFKNLYIYLSVICMLPAQASNPSSNQGTNQRANQDLSQASIQTDRQVLPASPTLNGIDPWAYEKEKLVTLPNGEIFCLGKHEIVGAQQAAAASSKYDFVIDALKFNVQEKKFERAELRLKVGSGLSINEQPINFQISTDSLALLFAPQSDKSLRPELVHGSFYGTDSLIMVKRGASKKSWDVIKFDLQKRVAKQLLAFQADLAQVSIHAIGNSRYLICGASSYRYGAVSPIKQKGFFAIYDVASGKIRYLPDTAFIPYSVVNLHDGKLLVLGATEIRILLQRPLLVTQAVLFDPKHEQLGLPQHFCERYDAVGAAMSQEKVLIVGEVRNALAEKTAASGTAMMQTPAAPVSQIIDLPPNLR